MQGYTAMRAVRYEHGAFLLNGLPYRLRLVLDQGYWPEGGLSATTEELRLHTRSNTSGHAVAGCSWQARAHTGGGQCC